MKKLLSIILILLLLPVCAGAASMSGVTVAGVSMGVAAEGTFTQANARLSLVDGIAFFWVNGLDASAYAGLDTGSHEYLIKVYDDDGYSIQGYVGAVGGGETLGADTLAGFDFDVGWTDANANIVDSNTFLTTAANGYVQKRAMLTKKTLYKITFDSTQTGGTTQMFAGISLMAEDGDTGVYFVSTSTYVRFGNTDNGVTADIVTGTAEPVTDCAATGFHVISAQGGSTQNWQNVSASFNYKDGNYTYSIYKVR